MAKKKSPGSNLFDQFNGLSADEQAVFARACLADPKNVFAKELYYQDLRTTMAEMSVVAKNELTHELMPLVEKAERFNQRGKKHKSSRDDRIRELGEIMSGQEIYDKHGDELAALDGGRKPSVGAINKVLYPPKTQK